MAITTKQHAVLGLSSTGEQIAAHNRRFSTWDDQQFAARDAKLSAMIFRSYWLDRRERHAKDPHWVKVRVMYGMGYDLLWVLDPERGIYPVDPNSLKTEFELPAKERKLIEQCRKYSYM